MKMTECAAYTCSISSRPVLMSMRVYQQNMTETELFYMMSICPFA